MSKEHKVYLMEQLQSQREHDGKREVHFRWDEAAQTWRVTCEGLPVPVDVAAELIAASEALGMRPPEPDYDLSMHKRVPRKVRR